jgi:HD-like signal output (HDOD) protein
VNNPDLDAQAANTLRRIIAGLDSQKQLPMVSQLVRLIRDISGRAENMSIEDLVEAISAEPTTLARIMSMASTMVYNPGGGEISSIHQAVLAVGFEQVRRLAISILLLENAQSRFSAEANRELASTALVSGLIAAEMGRRFLSVDPDLAFVCGALRSYGRMLAATFLPEDYSSMLRNGVATSPDEAFQETFGITPLDLGRRLLNDQQLPKSVLDSLVEPAEETRGEAGRIPSSALIAAAEFGLRLSEVLQSPDLTNENFISLVENLSKQYGESLLLTELPIREMVARVSLTLRSFSTHCRLSLESVLLFRRLDCLVNSRPIPRAFRPRGKSPPAASFLGAIPAAGGVERDESTVHAAKSIESCTDVVMRLVSEPHPDPRRIFELLLQALERTLNLSNCLVFVKHQQSGLFRVTRGVGSFMRFAQDTVALDPEGLNIFSEVIRSGRDRHIQDPNEPSIRKSIPEWLCPPDRSFPILLLPIQAPSGTFALVCATCNESGGFDLAQKLRPELQLLLAQVARVGEFLT